MHPSPSGSAFPLRGTGGPADDAGGMHPGTLLRGGVAALAAVLTARLPAAAGQPAESYPLPYRLPTVEGVAADLERVRGFLEIAMPGRIVDRRTGSPIAELSSPVANAVADRGAADAFGPLIYEVGVIHSGMVSAAEATGDPKFADFTARQFRFIANALPYFRAQAARFGMGGNSFRMILAPQALDDCGAMTTAMIQARLAHIGPDLLPIISGWRDYIERRQYRLPDGAFARHRPQPVSVWSDDLYMGIPALAEWGRMTGERAVLDDAANAALKMADVLFQPQAGLFAHGWSADTPEAPAFYWARANGWATLALCDLLDALPADHPARPRILRLLRAQLRAVGSLQSAQGRWHQLLDRGDSFLETSASAMFVYGTAHAINRGWISPAGYGNIAQVGWLGVSTQINGEGQVEGTCVGTSYAADPMYYCNRPVSVYAVHGYGPVLLAGAEMIRLLRNPGIEIRSDNHTFQFVPR